MLVLQGGIGESSFRFTKKAIKAAARQNYPLFFFWGVKWTRLWGDGSKNVRCWGWASAIKINSNTKGRELIQIRRRFSGSLTSSAHVFFPSSLHDNRREGRAHWRQTWHLTERSFLARLMHLGGKACPDKRNLWDGGELARLNLGYLFNNLALIYIVHLSHCPFLYEIQHAWESYAES